jgi:hypothetical protein
MSKRVRGAISGGLCGAGVLGAILVIEAWPQIVAYLWMLGPIVVGAVIGAAAAK